MIPSARRVVSRRRGRRKADIPRLAEFLLERLAVKGKGKVLSVSPRAMSVLTDYDWPGNVRELESVLEHAIVCPRGGAIEPDAFPASDVGRQTDHAQQAKRSRASVSATDKKDVLLRALEASRWKRSPAAARLRIDRTPLWRKMRRWSIVVPRD